MSHHTALTQETARNIALKLLTANAEACQRFQRAVCSLVDSQAIKPESEGVEECVKTNFTR